MASKLAFSVGVFFLMMIPGIIMKKCKISTDGLGKGLSNLVLYVAQPTLIFRSYLKDFDKSVLINMLYILAFSVVAHTVFAVVARLVYKRYPTEVKKVLTFATVFSNAAFMGIPLIKDVLGDHAIIYASIYNITFNMFLWTLGVYIFTSDKNSSADDGEKRSGDISLKRALLHPTMIAAALGLVFFFLPINNYVPEIIDRGLMNIENLVAPLSMVVVGLRLAEMDLRGFFKEKSLYLFLALRHLALPAIVFFIMRFFTLIGVGIHFDVMMSILIMASAPAATTTTMFAEKYDADAVYASKIVTVSTILSLATMPLVSLLINI